MTGEQREAATSPAPNLNSAWARAVAQELARAGVTRAVICPGSRSAPLALALDEVFGAAAHTCLDERSGAFVALGAAKASGAPAVVLATSGSAGAHFFPAVLEAEAGHLPLVCLTADRPPELHGFGAPQTVDQRDLFGRHVRACEDLPLPEASDAAFAHLRAVVSRAVAVCRRAPRGPLHLNLPFREPLAPVTQPFAALSPLSLDGRAGAPALAHASPPRVCDPAVLDALACDLDREPRGLVVVGPRDADDGLADAADELSRRCGWPVIADGASGLRATAAGRFVTHADLLLRHGRTAEALRPALVLRLGGGLTSKVLQQWLDASGARVLLVSDQGSLFDPSHVAAQVVEADVAGLCRELARRLRGPASPVRDRALALDTRAAAALAPVLGATLTEPVAVAVAARAVPAGGQVFVSSSMPVRDLDAFAGALPGVRVLANRGLNGIDGLVSCAAGAALGAGRPTVLLTGDLAFLHDLTGLVAAARLRVALTVVVVDNDGGGIFHFLPVSGATPRFEALFGTPHGLDLSHAAALAGATYHAPSDPDALAAAVRAGSAGGGLHLVHVRARRAFNVEAHRDLQSRVAAALERE